MMFDAGPPAAFERVLVRAVRSSPYADDIVGDLREAYLAEVGRRSAAGVRLWYCHESIRLALRFGVRGVLSARPSTSTVNPSVEPGGQFMDRLLADIRFAVRALAKQPAVTAAIILTLAIGIGANASVFGVVDALLLHPFNMRDVDRIVMPVTTSPRWSGRRETASPADFLDWRQQFQGGAIEHLAGIDWWDANLVGRDEPERVPGFFVSPEFFAAFDTHAALGRTFLPEEGVAANAKRVVLSDALWRRRFGGDPQVIGRPVLIDGAQWIVVGVMPPEFDFPMRSQIWAPLVFDEKTTKNRTAHYLTVVGRLADGRSLAEAQAQMHAIVQRLGREHPDTNAELGGEVYTISRGMADVGVPQVLALWQAAGVFVLLIACANIANLLLARAAEREREVAIRLALGSSRGRIVRGSFVESLLLVLAATPLALAVGWTGLRLMHAFMPARIVRFIAGWDRMGLDVTTTAVTIGCAAVAAIAFGTLPAWHMARGAVSEGLKTDGRAGAGPGRQRTRRALVVAEVALALPLLVAAVMSISTVTRFLTSWQGYDPSRVLTMRVVLPPSKYPDVGSRERFIASMVERLQALPGARAAAAANILPATDSNARRSIERSGQPVADPTKAPRVDFRAVTPAYFDVVRTPVVSGRAFSMGDSASGEPVAIVSESMARKFWPAGSPLGQQLRLTDGAWMRVVGVCGDVVHDWFDGRVPTLYVPFAQAPSDSIGFAIATTAEPLALAADARKALSQVDSMQPAYDVMTLQQVLSDRTISLQYIAAVMGAFAGVALLLALVGLYAVMTYLVARRVREIGVRIALGATGGDVVRLTLIQAARLTAAGIAIGALLAVALGRAIEAGLLGIVSADLRITVALAALLAITSLAASYLPARRAAAVDPMVALRTE